MASLHIAIAVDLLGGSTTDSEGNHCPRVTKIVRIRKKWSRVIGLSKIFIRNRCRPFFRRKFAVSLHSAGFPDSSQTHFSGEYFLNSSGTRRQSCSIFCKHLTEFRVCVLCSWRAGEILELDFGVPEHHLKILPSCAFSCRFSKKVGRMIGHENFACMVSMKFPS